MQLSEDERTRMIEESREKARRDEAARMNWAKQAGLEQGENLKARTIAKSLLRKQMPVSEVAELTGLSPEEVSELLDTPHS